MGGRFRFSIRTRIGSGDPKRRSASRAGYKLADKLIVNSVGDATMVALDFDGHDVFRFLDRQQVAESNVVNAFTNPDYHNLEAVTAKSVLATSSHVSPRQRVPPEDQFLPALSSKPLLRRWF